MLCGGRDQGSVFVLTAYLDESGTDENSSHVIVGGYLFTSEAFKLANLEWKRILDRYRLKSIHMRDLKASGLSSELQAGLVGELAEVISTCELGVLVELSMGEYDRLVSASSGKALATRLISPYAACFGVCVRLLSDWANRGGTAGTIGYVMDEGNPYRNQIVDIHFGMKNFYKEVGHNVHLGALAFDDDSEVWALQAADMICWEMRRFGETCFLPINKRPPISTALNSLWLAAPYLRGSPDIHGLAKSASEFAAFNPLIAAGVALQDFDKKTRKHRRANKRGERKL